VHTESFAGWDRVAVLKSGAAELKVTLDVGPRIISLTVGGGENLFHVFPGDLGTAGGTDYRFYGGHRLWIAPEELPRTYQPENEPVETEELDGGAIRFTAPTDRNHVQKSLEITPLGDETFRIDHSLKNCGAFELNLSAWALTMLRKGSVVFFPQPAFAAHTADVLPARPLVLWRYSNLADSRWHWGKELASLTNTDEAAPQKIGTFVEQGYAAAQIGDVLLVKSFPATPGNYPDFGCNFETFTNEEMIEIETLGAFQLTPPGESVRHTEVWRLLPNLVLGTDDGATLASLA